MGGGFRHGRTLPKRWRPILNDILAVPITRFPPGFNADSMNSLTFKEKSHGDPMTMVNIAGVGGDP